MADDGWIVKGAPKKKPGVSPNKAAGPAPRTGESANRNSPSGKKFPASSPSHGANRSKPAKPKPTFEHRNDEDQFQYDDSKLSWKVPQEIFERIITKFPEIKTLTYGDYTSRWAFMRSMERSHWYYTDDLIVELKEQGLKPVDSRDFFSAMLHALVSHAGLVPYYSPAKYTDEWQHWQKYCRVGGIALVRQEPESKEWEVLMVKNKNNWFSELSTSWPGGKAELTDATFWELASRELKEETNIDVSGDKSKVCAVIEGNRAISFVIPIAYDDARLSNIVLEEKEIHSSVWVKLSLDLSKIKEPAKETRDNSTSVLLPKEDPADLRMAWEVRENFRKLQLLNAFDTPQEGLAEFLERDPRRATGDK